MKTLVVDIEANGLYDCVTQIHCIVAKDKSTGEIKKFFDGPISASADGTVEEGARFLQTADVVVGHNWIDYDARVLRKFFPFYSIDVDKIRDTYIRSLMFDPHRAKHPNCPTSKTTVEGRRQIGPHGLENWGYIVGRGKVEHEDWTVFTEEMLHRCVEDVEITNLVDDRLIYDAKGWDWSVSERIEKQFRLLMSEQEGHGWLFDKPKALQHMDTLTKRIEEIDNEVLPKIPPVVTVAPKASDKIRKKDGAYTANFVKWFEGCCIDTPYSKSAFVGAHSRVTFEQINLASQPQIKEYLLSVGWVPTEWNYKMENKRPVKGEDGKYIKSSPKLTEDSFGSLQDDTGKLIAERITLCHRRAQINGWVENLRPDGRIGAGGNSVGTNTARVAHRTVVNVPKAEDGIFFGKEMRELFVVPKGHTLVGADLSALEDRLAGHHTFKYDGGSYAQALLEGDPHQKTADALGVSRGHGKACNHALKYGAQAPKLAEMLGVTVPAAAKMWNDWWDAHPSLSQLKDALDGALEKRGFLKGKRLLPGAFIRGIDGRKVFIRSPHSVLNARIQNAGSTVHKLVCIYIKEGVEERWLDAQIVGNFHDETQTEVRDEDVGDYKEVIAEAEQRVNEFFGFKIPMKLEPELGSNWKETH